MKFDTQKYSYASRRTVSFAKNGMVATSSPLPAQVGLDVLKKAAMPLTPQLLPQLHCRSSSPPPMVSVQIPLH